VHKSADLAAECSVKSGAIRIDPKEPFFPFSFWLNARQKNFRFRCAIFFGEVKVASGGALFNQIWPLNATGR